MSFYFLRHANAGEPMHNLKKDERRPLDDDGVLQCRYIGRALAAMGVSPDLVCTSPLKRALQTAHLVMNEVGYDGKITKEDALRPGADVEEFRALVARCEDAENVFFVGHNPNLSQFLGHMIGPRTGAARVELKKGAVARVDIEGKQAVLQWLLTPKAARGIYEMAVESRRPKTSRK